MKKILLIAATSTALLSSFSVLACDGCGDEPKVVPVAAVSTTTTVNENQFYGKIEGGGAFFNRLSTDFARRVGEGYKKAEVKFKAKSSGIFGVGVGYYLMDNFRVEATIHKTLDTTFKCDVTQTIKDLSKSLLKQRAQNNAKNSGIPLASDWEKEIDAEVDRIAGKSTIKFKAELLSALLNGYVDLVDLGGAKIFAGGGIGWAQAKSKFTFETDGKEDKEREPKNKTVNNFAYQLTLGTSVDLTDTIKGEISYSFRDYGKAFKKDKKKDKILEKYDMKAPSFRSHNVMLGLRFNF